MDYMNYQINLGQWNMLFAVPSSVVDRHLKLASEAQLKVLLYILRHAGEGIDAAAIAAAVGIAPSEVDNAVSFWIERGLVRSGDDMLLPAEDQPSSKAVQSPPTDDAPEQKTEPPKRTAVSRAVRPDTAFVTRRIGEDSVLAGLMEEAQSVLAKPLSPADAATLVMLHDTFGLPCAVLAMLLNYAASVGSANMRAVERIGVDWSDKGVCSVEAAEQEIERLTSSREAWGTVRNLIGIRSVGNPSRAQLANASRWIDEWGFNDEMIVEAYERCVNAKSTFSLSYMNAILKRWYEKKIFSLDALKAYEAAAKSAKKTPSSKGSVYSAEGASFDLSAYESKSLFDDD
jgi:DnaD/phage-associated family protein